MKPDTVNISGLSITDAVLRARTKHAQKFGPIALSDKDRQQVDDATRFETQLIDGERVILIDRRKTTKGNHDHEYSYDRHNDET